MYFSDSDPKSGKKIGDALGLKFSPPGFIAFFPKEVEEELARKERDFANRKESEIYSTTFRVMKKDGKFVMVVTDQVPIKK
jgi:hypothetical protein